MCCEIGTQPLFLARASIASADIQTFTIQDDDMPGAKFVAVIAILGVARGGAGAGFHAAPSLIVALKIFFGAIWIGEVAGNHYGARNLLEELCGSFRAREIGAVRDVPSANEDSSLIPLRRS